MSPRGIPYSYRHMHGFGSHTYSFINAENQRIWVCLLYTSDDPLKTFSKTASILSLLTVNEIF